jgi:hypothetical protein
VRARQKNPQSFHSAALDVLLIVGGRLLRPGGPARSVPDVSPARKGWDTMPQHTGAPWARHWIHRILVALTGLVPRLRRSDNPCNRYPSPSGLGLRLAGRPAGPKEPSTNYQQHIHGSGVKRLRFLCLVLTQTL